MAEPPFTADSDESSRAGRRPALIVFDVNETLSDMGPIADRFGDVGADRHVADTWFASLLVDGFALAVNDVNPAFGTLMAEQLRHHLRAVHLDRPLEDAVEHVLAGFSDLQCHPDVVAGVAALSDSGIRLVTLSNGAASIARGLLEGADILDRFERLLSVEQAGFWKPDPRAYAYALDECGVAAADAMLVAVHPWDTDGARRAGLSSAWINRRAEEYPGYFLAPTVEAESLPDLADRLSD